VIDGAVRDVAEIEELRFPCSRPVSCHPPIREVVGDRDLDRRGGIAVSPGTSWWPTRTAWSWFRGNEVDELVTRARELDAVERRWPPPRQK